MLAEIRAAFRLARVGVHLLWGAATVAVVYPWLDPRWRRALTGCARYCACWRCWMAQP